MTQSQAWNPSSGNEGKDEGYVVVGVGWSGRRKKSNECRRDVFAQHGAALQGSE